MKALRSTARRPAAVAAAAAAAAASLLLSAALSALSSAPACLAFAPLSPSRPLAAAFAPSSPSARLWKGAVAFDHTATGRSPSRAESSSSSSSSPTRVHLFRDLLKKVRGGDGDGDGDGDDEKKKKDEEESSPAVEKSAEEKSAASGANVPFFAETLSSGGQKEEAPEAEAVEAEVRPDPEPATAAAEKEEEAQPVAEEKQSEDDEAAVDAETIIAAAAITAAAASVADAVPAPAPASSAPEPAPELESEPPKIAATAPEPAPPEPQPKKEPLSPLEEARALRAAAEKARLEAEKMDAQLTLEKITKLETELGSKKVRDDGERARGIREQLEQLNKKLSGEDPALAPAAKKKAEDGADAGKASTVSPLYSRDASTGETKLNTDALGLAEKDPAVILPGTEPLTDEQIAERVELFEKSPDFLKVLVATTAGFEDVKSAADINATALVLKLHEDDVVFRKNQAEVEAENMDLVELTNALKKSGGEVNVITLGDSKEKPKFTQKEIDAKVKDLEAVPQFVKNLFPDDIAKNDTALAIKMLTDDWENEQMRNSLWGGGGDDKSKKQSSDSSGDGGGSSLFGGFGGDLGDAPEADRMIQSLFPKQVYDREDGTAPTDATMKIVMEDVLTKLRLFSPSGQPESVAGGFVVRGVNNYDDGKSLIDAIDAQMAKSPRAKGRVLVHFVSDPTPVTEEQIMMGDRDPVLFVTGPELQREANRPLLAGVSAVAVASTWYTALYPFLINPDVLKRAEEQLDLANAGMEYNLDWLTSQAVPLYAAFVAAIAAHEIAHRAVAGAYGMNVTVPTLVPSLVTGVTGQITAFKDPPRDRQEMMDFALAGPVAGILTSAALLFAGCGLTRTADAASYANFPALPVDVLRQSSLGAGIIEGVLGNGVLSVPMSAAATSAVADINISLHPLAIAGFFGLLVNACALLPFGRTDGGRIALALFGRSGTQLVGLITLVTLFLAGLTVSDLLLFYFSFIAFFQGELEIPCRNEVDEVDFSRVLFATAGGVLMLLTLIPMV